MATFEVPSHTGRVKWDMDLEATGLARETIRWGRREIARGDEPTGRIRAPGGGRPRHRAGRSGSLIDPPDFALQRVPTPFVL